LNRDRFLNREGCLTIPQFLNQPYLFLNRVFESDVRMEFLNQPCGCFNQVSFLINVCPWLIGHLAGKLAGKLFGPEHVTFLNSFTRNICLYICIYTCMYMRTYVHVYARI